MIVCLVAGKCDRLFLKQTIQKWSAKTVCFIGIDKGSLTLVQEGLYPDLVVGDFDSLTKKEYEYVKENAKEHLRLPKEKDDTDTQVALKEAITRFPHAKYILLGATGGRIDHFLANLYLPLERRFYPYLRNIKIIDEQNSISFYAPGKYSLKKEEQMHYLAYVALTPVLNLTLEKSKYTLKNKIVFSPFSYTSNEFVTKEAFFSFESGVIAVIQSKDQS